MNYYGKILIAVFTFVLAMSPNRLLSAELDAFLSSNVLAVVTGYQTERTLPSGISVPLFSVNPEAGNGTERGILFYVIAPSSMAGFFFWMHHDGLMASGRSFDNYNPNAVYSFRYSSDTTDLGSVTPSNLFRIAVSGPSLCSLRPLGKQLYLSQEEVSSALSRLDGVLKTLEHDIAKCNEELANLKPDDRAYKRKKGEIKFLLGQVEKISAQKKTMVRKSDEIRTNVEFVRTLMLQPSVPIESNHEH